MPSIYRPSPPPVNKIKYCVPRTFLAARRAYVLFAGSLPPGLDAETLERLVAVCRDRNAYVAIDSSGPGLDPVRHGGPLWLVKPNREELGELAGRPVETDLQMREAAESLLERIELVVVTLGPEGACLFTRTGAWRATPHLDPAEIVNTVGCGDALLAGFVYAHARGGAPEECLRHGVALGSAAALKARTGEADPEDAERLYATVEVAPVA